MAINFGKGKETLFASTDLMSFGKAFSRMAAQPLDMYEVWYDYDALVAYAANTDEKTATAYVGQKVVYIDADNKVFHYSIEANGSLKELGVTPVGDNSSIVVDENGTISLKGVGTLVFEREVEGKEEKEEVSFQPLMTKNGLVWVEPSKTTVEGLATLIEALTGRVGALESVVGKEASEGVEATGLVKAVADEVARATAAEEALGKRIDAIDYVDGEELEKALEPYAKSVDLEPYAKSADVVSNATYAVDKKALDDKDVELAAAAKEAKDAADAAQAAIKKFLEGTGAEEVIDTLTDIQKALDDLTDPAELAQAIAGKADKTELANYVTNDAYGEHLTAQSQKDSEQDQALIDYKAEVVETLKGYQTVIPAETYDAYGSAAAAEKNAKDYADVELAKKVDKVDGFGLLSAADQAKLNKLTLDGEDLTISGSVEAGSVKNLDTWLTNNRDSVTGLYPTADATKLSNIEAGAQVNIIEGVQVNGTDLIVNGKKVNIDLSAYATVEGLNGVNSKAEQGIANAATAQSKADSAYTLAGENKTELERIAPIVSNNSSAVTEHGSKLTTLEGKVSTAEGKISTLEGNVGTNTNDIATLKTTVGNHSTKFGELEIAIENINTNIGANSANVTTLKSQLHGIAAEEGAVLALINEAKKAGTDANKAAAEAKGIADSAVAGVNLNAGNITSLTARVDAIDGANGSIATINGRLNAIDGENGSIATINGQLSSIDGRVTTVEGKVGVLESTITGLSGAMHFRGISSTDPMVGDGPSIENVSSYAAGDVVIYNGKEYVFDGSVWHLFGDEGSYALKNSVYTKNEIDGKLSDVASAYTSAISTAKQEAIDAAASDATGKANAALASAKEYVDSCLTWVWMTELPQNNN